VDTYPHFWDTYQSFLEDTSNMLLSPQAAQVTEPFILDFSVKKVDEFMAHTLRRAASFFIREEVPEDVFSQPVRFSVKKDLWTIKLPVQSRAFPATRLFLKEIKYPLLKGMHLLVKDKKS